MNAGKEIKKNFVIEQYLLLLLECLGDAVKKQL
jgi:hypothetical protein